MIKYVKSMRFCQVEWRQEGLMAQCFCPSIFMTEIDMPTYCYSDLLHTAEEDPHIETTCTLLQ